MTHRQSLRSLAGHACALHAQVRNSLDINSNSSAAMSLSRRSFVVWLSTALPVAMIARRAHALSVDALSQGASTTRTLEAVGAVVLPTELGSTGTVRVVAAFQRWIAGYREHAELVHGYGTSRIRYTGPTPATRWAAQLDALDADARASKPRRVFADLPVAEREKLLRTALAGERVDRMPAVGDANHVAIALLSFFYDSPEATNLCYQAQIDPQTCRPLSRSTQEPLRIGRRATGVTTRGM